MKKLQTLLEQKREAIKLKTGNLQDQAKQLIRSRAALERQIVDNTNRVHYLKSVNEELGLIAQAASRDLKKPLRSIGTHIDQLGKRLHKLDQTEGLEEYLHYVSDGASRMNAMVDDLLQYCDPSSKQLTTRVNTSEVLEVIESNLSNLLIREDAHLIIQADMPTISGHKTEVLQLFQNLITNGIKFRKPRVVPVCRIGFSRKENEVCFHVSDNGIGIPANRVNDVFGLFTRLHERGSYEGTGIGLAICRRIVLSAGGEIWAESTEGEGTTFFFTWPLTVEKVLKDGARQQQLVSS